MDDLRTTEVAKAAAISEDGVYRYWLSRWWDLSLPTVSFIMLNPSTADHEKDDPTVRRCMGYAMRWGFGRLNVLNLYALRTPYPQELWMADDPIGPMNDFYIEEHAVGMVVAAWGASAGVRGSVRAVHVRKLLADRGRSLSALRLTAGGHPGHPLYLPRDLKPIPYP